MPAALTAVTAIAKNPYVQKKAGEFALKKVGDIASKFSNSASKSPLAEKAASFVETINAAMEGVTPKNSPVLESKVNISEKLQERVSQRPDAKQGAKAAFHFTK